MAESHERADDCLQTMTGRGRENSWQTGKAVSTSFLRPDRPPMHEFKAGRNTAGLVWIWHPSCWSVLWLHSTVSTIRRFGNRWEWHLLKHLMGNGDQSGVMAFDSDHHSVRCELPNMTNIGIIFEFIPKQNLNKTATETGEWDKDRIYGEEKKSLFSH